MNDLRERYEARKAKFEKIIANKTPTALEHLINTVKMPEKVRESLMKDYNQIYYNIKKENKTVRTARANDILFSSIQTILRSWKLREKAL